MGGGTGNQALEGEDAAPSVLRRVNDVKGRVRLFTVVKKVEVAETGEIMVQLRLIFDELFETRP